MELDLGAGGARLDGRPVADARSVEAALGQPSRTVTVDRPVPGLEERPDPGRLAVWDTAGIVAGDDVVMVVVGDNLLGEPVWPARPFPGEVALDGRPLDPGALAMDPLREQRYHHDLGRGHLTVLTDWRGAPVKLVVSGLAEP